MPSYGPPITTEQAKKAAAAALAEARANNWTMAAAVVDPGGILVYFEKIDDTQNASPQIAIDKARSAALFKRPTKTFQDSVERGGIGLRVTTLRGADAGRRRRPLLVDGQIVGATWRFRRHGRAGRPVRQGRHRRHVTPLRAIRRVFWAAVWLAIVLVAIKAYYLGIPPAARVGRLGNYLRSLAAISYVDVLFAAVVLGGGASERSRSSGDRSRTASVDLGRRSSRSRRSRRSTRWPASSSSASSADF